MEIIYNNNNNNGLAVTGNRLCVVVLKETIINKKHVLKIHYTKEDKHSDATKKK